MNFTTKYLSNINNKIEKRLVYYCANGRYLDLVKINIEQLKKFHSGDIILLTDCDVSIHDVKIYKYVGNPIIGRMCIDKYINIKNYDKIMYIDADAIPLSRFNELWDIKNKDIGVTIQRKKIGQCYSRLRWLHTSCMTDEEFNRYKDRYTINAGLFITKINFFEEWRNIIDNKMETPGIDQAAFNKLMMIKHDYHEFKIDLVSSEKWLFNNKPNGAVFHFLMGSPQEKLNRMKNMIK
jgi:lipopolysaccharide biosynthesis glycosyltransferase